MIKRTDKCKYCFYNTAMRICSENPNECEDYEFNHLAQKYEHKRFKAQWEDGNDVHVLMVDELEQFPDWYLETVEDAEQLADFMNDLLQQSQDIEDRFKNGILKLLEKNFIQKYSQDNLVLGDVCNEKINVLEELLHEVGEDDMIIDFYEHMMEVVIE